MNLLILGILNSQAQLALALIDSQTAEEKKILWDRYITLTEPLHRLLEKIEGLPVDAKPEAATPAPAKPDTQTAPGNVVPISSSTGPFIPPASPTLVTFQPR